MYKCSRFKGFSDFSKIKFENNNLVEENIFSIKLKTIRDENGHIDPYIFIYQNKPSIDSNLIQNKKNP